MSYHADNIRQLLAAAPNGDTILYCCATLQPNPQNVDDANAVEIRIGGWLVGHLYREMAAKLHAVLDASGTSDGPTTCDAFISRRWDQWYEREQIFGRLALDLAHPAEDQNPVRPRYREFVFMPLLWGDLFVSGDSAIVVANNVSHDLVSKCYPGLPLEIYVNSENGNVHFSVPQSLGGAGRITVLRVNQLLERGIPIVQLRAQVLTAGQRTVVIRLCPAT